MSDKSIKLGFILLVLSYHILPIAHIFLGEIKFLGKNLIITLPVVFVAASFFVYMGRFSIACLFSLFLLVFAYFLLTWLSIIIYDTNISAFIDRRFCIVPVLMALVIFHLLAEYKYKILVIRVLILVTIIQCACGIIHSHFFPSFWYRESYFGYGQFENMAQYTLDNSFRTREAGTMISSSAYAYILLCGMIVIAYVKELPQMISLTLSRYLLQLYFVYGILLSGSRGPMILGMIILLSMIVGKQGGVKNTMIKLTLAVSTLIVFLYFGFDEILKGAVIDRTLSEGAGGRYEKFLLVFSMLSQGIIYLLIGVPEHIQLVFSMNGFVFSDNSFGLLLIVFGVSALVPIFILFYMMSRFAYLTRTILPVIVGLVCLSTTNAILWEPWIFYYLVTLALIFFSTRCYIGNRVGIDFISNKRYLPQV